MAVRNINNGVYSIRGSALIGADITGGAGNGYARVGRTLCTSHQAPFGDEQLRLVELVIHKMAGKNESAPSSERNIMELHGLGAEIWEGIDAQEYVNALREEWGRLD